MPRCSCRGCAARVNNECTVKKRSILCHEQKTKTYEQKANNNNNEHKKMKKKRKIIRIIIIRIRIRRRRRRRRNQKQQKNKKKRLAGVWGVIIGANSFSDKNQNPLP